MRVACRWPGGMSLVIPGAGGSPHRVVRLSGPRGVPSILPLALSRGSPSRNSATIIQRSVADTVKRLSDTPHGSYDSREYGITDVPGDFWVKWYEANKTFHVVTKKMVFPLED